MNTDLLVGAGGIIVAIISAWTAWYFARRAELGLVDWLSELRAWAADSVTALADARILANGTASEPPWSPERLSCIVRISALVDRGRFFLPNQPRSNPEDRLKPLAYRGYRHAALDPLIAAIRVLDGTSQVKDPPRVIFELQREFVSEVYRVLRPDHYSREIMGLIQSSIKSRESDLSLGGPLPGGAIPRGATAVLKQVMARISAKENHDANVRPRA